MEEDPLAAPPVPALVLAEASEPRAGGEVKAELTWGPWRRARFGQRLAFDRQRFISFGGAGLVDAAGGRGQQRQLGSRAFAVQQGGELPQLQVRARV